MPNESESQYWQGPWRSTRDKYEYVLTFPPDGRILIKFKEGTGEYYINVTVHGLAGGFGPHESLEEAKLIGIGCALQFLEDMNSTLRAHIEMLKGAKLEILPEPDKEQATLFDHD